jgi:phosphatidylserine decarboxylase
VKQITGAIARRIVPWARVGELMKRGERFGMIRFGSRTDLYLPLDSEILVSAGEKVKGGETAIARMAL